jgi:hypothetical protein
MGNDAWKLKCLEEAKNENALAILYRDEIASNVSSPRAFEKWTLEEDYKLRHNLATAITKLAEVHGRKPSAIMFRIVKDLNEIGIKLG